MCHRGTSSLTKNVAHIVAGDYRWGKNPLRDFPSEDSPETFRWGRFSPATRRWGKWQIFATGCSVILHLTRLGSD
ncbi:hypothetical protein Tco_1306899 [Tanacetum coccineum]